MSALRIFSFGVEPERQGHRSYLNIQPRNRVLDNQDQVVNALKRERAKQALYADCERAPLGWEDALPAAA